MRWITFVKVLSALLLALLASFLPPIAKSSSPPDVPEWAKHAVWYQIFPERFRNGDPANDPKLIDMRGSWPHVDPPEWQVSPWTSDWYKLQPWEQDGKGFYYHAQLRRYGGDLQGIIDKLDYLSDLGVNALYLNPIFESPSLHKYDATMYHHIDNNFGPDPDGDRKMWAEENPADPSTWKWTSADRLFLKLIHEAHARHIKIVIDGVFNHVGETFWALEDVRKNGRKSAFKDWFTITKWPDPNKPGSELEYKGWNGVKELPELRKDSIQGMASGPKEHIFAVVKRWMDPNGDGNPEDGVDGWRFDAAELVPMPFWRDLRKLIRSINPDAYTTGEIWWQDWNADKMFNAAPWLQGDAFDAVMNYRLAREVYHYFIDKENGITASEFDRRLRILRADYPEAANFVLMNLLDSHDTDRLTSHIVNPDLLYDHNVGMSDNKKYNPRKPRPDEQRIQRLMALFQMCYLGAPMVYYGDEVGMWGGDDPDDRKPMLWADMKYEDESALPYGGERPKDSNVADQNMLEYYKNLIHIRKSHEALMTGDISTVLADDTGNIYAFKRSTSAEAVIVVMNNSDSSHTVSFPAAGDWTNALDGSVFHTISGKFSASLEAKSGMILCNSGH